MSFTYQNLQLEVKEGIVVLEINRPRFLNALNAATIQELTDFFSRGYKQIQGLIGVILTGAGEKSFVAGADISEFNQLSGAEGRDFARKGLDCFFLIERFHVPVIAAVNGFALGGGCELAMSCHIRLASENAKFGQPEVNLGLIPGYGGTQRLVQLIGKSKALEFMLTGSMIDSQQALELGLVNYRLKQEDLMLFAESLIRKIASKGPVAISKVIESVNAYFDPSRDGYEIENQNFGVVIDTEDSTEGASAFLEKRKPKFTGK